MYEQRKEVIPVKFLIICRYQILKLNEAILNELSSKKHKDKRKINWSTLDKSRDYFLLLSELKQKQVYSFTEKRMSSLVRINEENFIRKIVNHNIQYFTNELKKVEALISNEKECERNRSSVSSEVSDDSESDVSSNLNLE